MRAGGLLLSEWLFVRDRTRTSTGYSSGTALNLPPQGTSEARIVLGRFASSTDERSEDRFRVRVGLDTSFMAIYMNITVYTSEDHRNNQSDAFKCVKLKGFEQQHRWPVGRIYGVSIQCTRFESLHEHFFLFFLFLSRK